MMNQEYGDRKEELRRFEQDATEMTKKERQVLRAWVAAGNSVYDGSAEDIV